ncbi:MAG: hypothetical protein HC800_25110 [Phormidesmis sp. RL_2_1]|nr:hypothetical protein [Phormidesmis sp. RL_2_1]
MAEPRIVLSEPLLTALNGIASSPMRILDLPPGALSSKSGRKGKQTSLAITVRPYQLKKMRLSLRLMVSMALVMDFER